MYVCIYAYIWLLIKTNSFEKALFLLLSNILRNNLIYICETEATTIPPSVKRNVV